MEPDLISKKELLELTGISYGQLYRWKRKNLIPEEWFIRKSTFTGQETFFPKDKILTRVDKIKNMKDDISLDELAGMFSPDLLKTLIAKDELIERNIVSRTSLDFFFEQPGVDSSEDGDLTFENVLFVYVLDQMLSAGEINLDEGKILFKVFREHYQKVEGKSSEVIFLRKLGIFTCFLVTGPSELYFENGVKVIGRLNLQNCIEELKIKIS